MKFAYWVIIAGLIIYLTAIRFWWLGEQSLWIDEGFSSLTSYFAMINNLVPIVGNETILWWYYYLHTLSQVFSFYIFGVNDFAARLPSVIFSILLLGVLILWLKNIFKDNNFTNIALYWGFLFLVLFYGFGEWMIIWSQQARFYSLLALIFITTAFFLYKYTFESKNKYFIYFGILAIIWISFHPFNWSLVALALIIIFYEFIEKYIVWNNKLTLKSLYSNFQIPIIIWSIWMFAYILSLIAGQWNILSFPNPTDIWNLSMHYAEFYNNHLLQELGWLTIIFLGLLIRWWYQWKIKLALFFGWLFGINYYFITSQWELMHSRYMFHLFPVIILIGSYVVGNIINYIYTNYENIKDPKNNILKIWQTWILALLIIMVVINYNRDFSLAEKRYIDHTSPQPDFQWAYQYINTNHQNPQIISWFPHLCYWYNKENTSKCKYALPVNMTWRESSKESLLSSEYERYSGVPYIHELNKSKFEWKQVVLDNMSMNMLIHSDIRDYILENCENTRNSTAEGKRYNQIGVWECEENRAK